MRLEKFKNARTGIVLIVVGILAITGLATLKGSEKPKEKTSTKQSSKKSKFVSTTHGVGGVDALTDSRVPGVSLDEARAKVGGKVSLPDTSVAGQPVEVKLNELDYADTGKWGMGVLYNSGIRLYISPGEENLQELLETESVPFEDGRKYPFKMNVINSRKSLIGAGGIQIDSRGRQFKAFPIIIWNMNGMKYQLRTFLDEVTIGDLIKAAESIK